MRLKVAESICFSKVIGKGFLDVGHGQGSTGKNEGVGGEGLEGALTVVRGEEIEVAGKDIVDAYHLAMEELADAVVAGVGIVAWEIVKGVVARFGGDDVEDVDGGVALSDVPLGGIGIIGWHRNVLNRLKFMAIFVGDEDNHTDDRKQQYNGKY